LVFDSLTILQDCSKTVLRGIRRERRELIISTLRSLRTPREITFVTIVKEK